MGREIRQRYGHLARFAALALLSLGLARGAILVASAGRVDPALVPQTLLFGLRFDLITVAWLLVPPLFLAALTPAAAARVLSTVLRVYYRGVYVALLVMEAIGVGFLAEYDHRPDALLWEYLQYPDEVSQMLLRGYAPQILGALVTGVTAYAVARRVLLPADLRLPRDRPAWSAAALQVPVFLVIAAVLTLSIRSSLGHRPANISTAQFSDSRLANELALNSAYTAGYALYARRYDVDNVDLYGRMPFDRALELVLADRPPAGAARTQAELPTVHRVEPTAAPVRPRNVVIVLEESLGARFTGALGGADLTPRFDRLSESGVLFTNLYATGTRTTRGIEAVLSGFPPSASQSVVKRGKSRRDFFTLAQLLGQHGYRSFFLYGGEANFDDMGSFMLGNGFDRVIAGADEYPDAQFVGSWGVSDEDWARRAHREFERAHAEGPFFALMLSTSNHSPWEFPDGRIEPVPGVPLASRENSVRYADYALGVFFDLAQQSDYYDDTLFLVVADHDSRVYGDEFVPIDYFHVPALLIGKDLAPSRYTRLASQIDLVPTILPLLGIATQSPAIGEDLFAADPQAPGRALMQYGLNNALMRGDDVVVRLPRTPVKQFRRDRGELRPAPVDPQLAALSLAYLTLANDLYEQQRYRMPAPASSVRTAPVLTHDVVAAN